MPYLCFSEESIIFCLFFCYRGFDLHQNSVLSLVAQTVKNQSARQETQVQSLGQEDPLEKEMAIHSSILAWKNPMVGGTWQATAHGLAELEWTEQLTLSLFRAVNQQV